MAQNEHHRLNYVELSVTDLSAAQAFYSAAFGWRFNDYGPEYAGIVGAGGSEVGGLAKVAERPGQGGPLVLLYSDDLDATVEAVTAAGGSVVNGPYPFPGGRRFHFTDPSGNELGVWATS
ncbi:VOC family protein [Rhodococcus sp. BP-252]|uniref:Glyoxalase n=1 Tax=Rhodococcoides kyotonense TaxID=398843 RepID=A0A177YEP7_9NOCA|nr:MULTISPECIES: VOC family protein [Rhodococcus]MBY6414096.1 VOC family protein [Rhodococcus sp. BP-320]MBY6418867.1 VOC family protein [Rhodococcus sp. BP-321]MBY6423388.1 VOC family protein [Rhodococcus sp. BP-324]MBY6428842.1 VOC family protein [Rhodococcus sp. BP-323]MBY6433848.1 VOC family protein [Rhodococcus sp. BP-322]